ncbi:LysR family transcriptional regulator [Paracoccus sp. R86501]|uniref:LysR family transcriptional regulator n=1 Tax=Paracoccus sp. R86501 TaxID=3101711 RepID=UPI00366FB77E
MDRLTADRMFVQVVRTGSFSAAAAQAGVSPGQASKLVSRLETHLRIRLLTRTTRAISLTPEGEAYLVRITAILDQMDELDDSLRDAAANPSGLLRLTAPLTFGTVQLMPALNDFARAHPAVTLQVDFTDNIVSLAEQGVDLAIRAGPLRDSALIGRKLGVMRIQIVAAPDYLAARGTPQQPGDLHDHDIVTDLNFAQPDEWQLMDGTRRVTLTLPGRLRFSNAEACVSATIAGLGITRVPDFISAPAVRDGRLAQLFPAMTPQQIPIMAITPTGRHMPTRVRLLVDFLRDRWGPDHKWDD